MTEILQIVIILELAAVIAVCRPNKSGQKKVRARRKEKRRLKVQMTEYDKKLWQEIDKYPGCR